jgi:hypothetical protein
MRPLVIQCRMTLRFEIFGSHGIVRHAGVRELEFVGGVTPNL